MNQAPSTEKIEFFLRNVFDYLDRYTEFTERPMADERHWIGVNAPIIQLIFIDDVVVKRPITANYVTLFVTGQVFTLEQYVDASVKVLQSLREEDLPDVVVEYVNNLVEVYAQSVEITIPSRPGRVRPRSDLNHDDPPSPQLDYSTAIVEKPDLDPDLAAALKIDAEPAIEEKPALGEEEKPPGKEPVKRPVAQISDQEIEGSNGWR